MKTASFLLFVALAGGLLGQQDLKIDAKKLQDGKVEYQAKELKKFVLNTSQIHFDREVILPLIEERDYCLRGKCGFNCGESDSFFKATVRIDEPHVHQLGYWVVGEPAPVFVLRTDISVKVNQSIQTPTVQKSNEVNGGIIITISPKIRDESACFNFVKKNKK